MRLARPPSTPSGSAVRVSLISYRRAHTVGLLNGSHPVRYIWFGSWPRGTCVTSRVTRRAQRPVEALRACGHVKVHPGTVRCRESDARASLGMCALQDSNGPLWDECRSVGHGDRWDSIHSIVLRSRREKRRLRRREVVGITYTEGSREPCAQDATATGPVQLRPRSRALARKLKS